MNGKFSYDTLKDAADKAYKSGDRFAESAQLYTKILEECNLNDQERNKIRGNRCLASQKSGEHHIREMLPHLPTVEAFFVKHHSPASRSSEQ